MSLAYLQPEDARAMLITGGKFSDETVPTVEALTFLLEMIEVEIDTWVGFRFAPTEYTETIGANNRGVGATTEYPILSIVAIVPASTLASASLPETVPPNSWLGDLRTIHFGRPGSKMKVTYVAGYDPIPAKVKYCAFAVLGKILEVTGTSGDLSFLYQASRDAASLSLPGGLSKSWSINSGGKDKSQTELDRLLTPLQKEQRIIITITS